MDGATESRVLEMCQAVRRTCHTGGVLLLAIVVVVVVALAAASPTDPTWIGGIYDNGDHDDAILALLAIEGLASEPVVQLAAAEAVQAFHAAPPPAAPSYRVEVGHSRSPPLA